MCFCASISKKLPTKLIMSDCDTLPSDVEDAAANAVSTLTCGMSKHLYEQIYECQNQWCAAKKIKNEANEKVLLAYFEHLSKHYKCSSLWAYYSMMSHNIYEKEQKEC